MHDIITTLFTRSWLLALAGAAMIGAQSVSAQTAADSKHDRTVRSRIALAQVLPNLDAGRLQVKLVEVTYPPGGFSAPHTHPCPVVVYVIAGALRVQVKGEPEAIYKAGESFYEAPNGEHLISANAHLVSAFVIGAQKNAHLTTRGKKKEKKKKKKRNTHPVRPFFHNPRGG